MYYYVFGAVLLMLYSCQMSSDPFPAVQDIKECPTTTMVATMEEQVDWDKNILYCPTLLYAWQEIKDTLPQPFVIDTSFSSLECLNNSLGHVGALEEGDYEKNITVGARQIVATTFFKANLLLETPLEKDPINLSFDGKEVACFGGYGDNKVVSSQAQVLFYESKEELAVLLSPKDSSQSLIFYKTKDTQQRTLEERYAVLKEKIVRYHSNAPKANTWIKKDILALPTLAFNLEKNYSDLEGTSFSSGSDPFSITKVQQRIALALDETGVLIESEAEVVVSRSIYEQIQSRAPLRLVFDDDFLLVAKKRTAEQPFLLAWISDGTFMTVSN